MPGRGHRRPQLPTATPMQVHSAFRELERAHTGVRKGMASLEVRCCLLVCGLWRRRPVPELAASAAASMHCPSLLPSRFAHRPSRWRAAWTASRGTPPCAPAAPSCEFQAFAASGLAAACAGRLVPGHPPAGLSPARFHIRCCLCCAPLQAGGAGGVRADGRPAVRRHDAVPTHSARSLSLVHVLAEL